MALPVSRHLETICEKSLRHQRVRSTLAESLRSAKSLRFQLTLREFAQRFRSALTGGFRMVISLRDVTQMLRSNLLLRIASAHDRTHAIYLLVIPTYAPERTELRAEGNES